MPSNESHVQNRIFLGDEASAGLVRWLNLNHQTEAQARILRIMELIWERGGHEELHAALYMYRYYPMIYLSARPVTWWPETHVPGPHFSRKLLFGDFPYGEESAVLDLVKLLEIGVLSGVRKCRNCGKWMFARFSHQHFCSSRCRERHFQSSPEWKALRNARQREYYRLHKTTNVISPERKATRRSPDAKIKESKKGN